MRRFTVYRRSVVPGSDRTAGGRFEPETYNQPEEPQCEGVVFSDGRVAVRWLTQFRSTVAWDSFEDFHKVHIWTHPDYGTEVDWHDGEEGVT